MSSKNSIFTFGPDTKEVSEDFFRAHMRGAEALHVVERRVIKGREGEWMIALIAEEKGGLIEYTPIGAMLRSPYGVGHKYYIAEPIW